MKNGEKWSNAPTAKYEILLQKMQRVVNKESSHQGKNEINLQDQREMTTPMLKMNTKDWWVTVPSDIIHKQL